MPYSSWTVIFGEIPSAAKWNLLGSNDGYFDTQAGSGQGTTSSSIWWQELGRQALSGAGDTISVTPITARKHIKILFSLINSASIGPVIRFNNDSGNNYSWRYNLNDNAATTNTSTSGVRINVDGSTSMWGMGIITDNTASREKHVSGYATYTGGTGAATGVSAVRNFGGKWANTADQITRIDMVNLHTGDFAIGSEIIVLGHN